MITARGNQGQVSSLAMAEAVARERRRVAADVHDLIMQDLSFALATARTLVDDPAVSQRAGVVVAASERALAGARDVVGALVGDDREPVARALEAAVRTAARNVPLNFEATGVSASARPDGLTRDTLIHVGREAVTNAVKHAGSPRVEVRFDHLDEWRLRVRDLGRGFDPESTSEGFGLESMRRHAEALGGSLRVTSAHGATGTIVELSLP
jgi:signal transduction histidine kinase